MSEIMSLVYLKETGNILTYVTRRAAPSDIQNIATLEKTQQDIIKAKELETIVGTELVIHQEYEPSLTNSKVAKFLIPADQLDILIAKVNPDVLKVPRTYFVNDEGKTDTVDSQPVTISAQTKTKVTVTAPRIVTQKVNVWLRVQAQNTLDSRIVTGSIDAGKDATDISFSTLPQSETYPIFVSVSGFKPIVTTIVVP